MRGVKAEGGWAVVSTEEVEIHPSSETAPYIEGRLWDDADIPAYRLVVEAIHRHGALAAIELVPSGISHNTMEQYRIQRRLRDLGVDIVPHHVVAGSTTDGVVLHSVFGGDPALRDSGAIVLVKSRTPHDELAVALAQMRASWADAGLQTMRAVGDALAPGTIAAAVWDGRRFAEELGGSSEEALFRRDVPAVGA